MTNVRIPMILIKMKMTTNNRDENDINDKDDEADDEYEDDDVIY
jgi:hypothetical protein